MLVRLYGQVGALSDEGKSLTALVILDDKESTELFVKPIPVDNIKNLRLGQKVTIVLTDEDI